MVNRNIIRLTVIDLWRYERSTIYRAIPHLSPIGLSVIHQADEKHVECYILTGSDIRQQKHTLVAILCEIDCDLAPNAP